MTKVAKLVRDKIPEIIKKDGRIPIVRQIHGDDLRLALTEKLQEEVQEFIGAKNDNEKLEELADILEVVFGLTKHLGVSQEEIMSLRTEKRDARGGFDNGVFYEGCKD